jgi:mono/diheme cytochrome c family protein
MPVSATVPAANPSSAVLDLAGVVSVEDTYRVSLIGTGPATLLDLDNNALDGEFSGAFPSGDGVQGGNFEAQFEVAGIQPTLQSIQDNVFTPICSGCHTGPSGGMLPAGLDLTSLAMSFTGLVNTASSQVPALDRVTPNDPDDSYLIQKLEGTAAVGARMPAFSPALDQATIDAIRDWISNGAPMQ